MLIPNLIPPELATKIVENFLILWGNGILLFFGSKYIARKMERFKANEGVRAALFTETAKQIGGVLELLSDLENAIEDMMNTLAEFDLKNLHSENRSHAEWAELYRSLALSLKQEKAKVLKTIDKKRFWLGKEYYDKLISHFDLLEEWFLWMDESKFTDAKVVWMKIEAGRISVFDVIKKLSE